MTTETINEADKKMERRTKEIASMRALIDHLEANPIIPWPSFYQVDAFSYDVDDLPAIARAMKPAQKEVSGSFYVLQRSFGSSIDLHVNFPRNDVCERVVVGSEFVEEKVIEAHTKDVVEWVCPDSLLRSDEEVSVG